MERHMIVDAMIRRQLADNKPEKVPEDPKIRAAKEQKEKLDMAKRLADEIWEG